MFDSLNYFFYHFRDNPWNALDNLDLSFMGFQFNLLRNDEKLRAAILEIFVLIPLIAWILLGADSTIDQLTNLVLNTPRFLLQQINLQQLLAIYNSYYGLGTHWSASVIYGLMLIGISKHLHEKLAIKNSLNLALTAGFVGIAIGCFEFTWQISYAVLQNQWWVIQFQFPQARILLQNFEFLLIGTLALLVLKNRGLHLNWSLRTYGYAAATMGLFLLWWNYGLFFPVQQLTVGAWTSTIYFPQTMYTVQMNPMVAVGEMFYVANEGVHLLNNVAKIMMTLMFYSLFQVKRGKPQAMEGIEK
jgi:hypothetical protein